MIRRLFLPLAIALWVVASYLLIFPDVRADYFWTHENGPVETLGALAFALSALLFFGCFFRKGKGGKRGRRNPFFLLLFLLFLVAFGEEISWGQHWIGWETPAGWQTLNEQQETNIHNLKWFKPRDEVGDGPLAFLTVLTAGRLFFYFWFFFLLLIPWLAAVWPAFRALTQRIRLPLAPLWVGGLLLLNRLLTALLKQTFEETSLNYHWSIDEIKETNYAIIILALAVYWFLWYPEKSRLTLHKDLL